MPSLRRRRRRCAGRTRRAINQQGEGGSSATERKERRLAKREAKETSSVVQVGADCRYLSDVEDFAAYALSVAGGETVMRWQYCSLAEKFQTKRVHITEITLRIHRVICFCGSNSRFRELFGLA
jgi:hypothetical protein